VEESASSRFDAYLPPGSPNQHGVHVLFEDHAGVLWCGTWGGLFRVRWTDDSPRFEPVLQGTQVLGLAEDRAGSLWVATYDYGLIEMMPSGETRGYGEHDGLAARIDAVAVDPQDEVWAGGEFGLAQLVRDGPTGHCLVKHVYRYELSWSGWISCLYVSRSGRLWAGTRGGAGEWTGDPKQPFRHWGAASGLTIAAWMPSERILQGICGSECLRKA
jgi:ligand-binding sensor domain-containing protein